MNTTVLNVEDYDAARYAKTRLIRNAGFSVIEADSGAATLELVHSLQPRLVLLDVKLHDIDGREVCRQIKNKPACSAIQVLLTSASFITREDVQSGLATGADGYLPAPFDPETLISAIRRLLQL